MEKGPLKSISQLDKELFEDIQNGRELAFKEGALSLKDKLLIAMAIDASKNAVQGVVLLGKQALASGATKEEIMEALRIVNYICGAGSMYPAGIALDQIFGEEL